MELFANNNIVIYIIVGFSIFCMSSFEEYQKINLFYVVSFFASVVKVMRIWQIFLISITVIFFMTEYFTNDNCKKNIILKFRYKILDFCYNMFFTYRFIVFSFSLMFMFFSHVTHTEWLKITLFLFSVFIMFICVHSVSTSSFETISLNELRKKFNKHLIYQINFSDNLRKRFDLLCDIEDKTYFQRKNSYNFLSFKFVKIKIDQMKNNIKNKKSLKSIYNDGVNFVKKSIMIRGYSTLEMQLVRILAIKSDYSKHVFRRKIYELVFTRVFFNSLKQEYEKYIYLNRKYFKEYLLYVYCKNVTTFVDGKRQPMVKYFNNQKNIAEWELEKMFIACIGLSGRVLSKKNIYLYDDIIKKYKLDKQRLLRLIK